jgi:hypothetical protein
MDGSSNEMRKRMASRKEMLRGMIYSPLCLVRATRLALLARMLVPQVDRLRIKLTKAYGANTIATSILRVPAPFRRDARTTLHRSRTLVVVVPKSWSPFVHTCVAFERVQWRTERPVIALSHHSVRAHSLVARMPSLEEVITLNNEGARLRPSGSTTDALYMSFHRSNSLGDSFGREPCFTFSFHSRPALLASRLRHSCHARTILTCSWRKHRTIYPNLRTMARFTFTTVP